MTKGKLYTTLVNDTDKNLVVYEVTSNGAQARLKELKPKPPPASSSSDAAASDLNLVTNTKVGETSVVDNPDFLVQSAVDPNDSYKTLRVWHGKEAVLGVSTDEMIDNTEIIIKFKDGEFTKTPISRESKLGKAKNKAKEVKNQVASKLGACHDGGQGDDSPSREESPRNSSMWGFFLKLFSKN
ncbi:unnamed protein product [Sphagnum compactum]